MRKLLPSVNIFEMVRVSLSAVVIPQRKLNYCNRDACSILPSEVQALETNVPRCRLYERPSTSLMAICLSCFSRARKARQLFKRTHLLDGSIMCMPTHTVWFTSLISVRCRRQDGKTPMEYLVLIQGVNGREVAQQSACGCHVNMTWGLLKCMAYG